MLDRPEAPTGAERPGGTRLEISIDFITPDMVGVFPPMKPCPYLFRVSLEAIGTKSDLQSSFQTLEGARWVEAMGGVHGGNTIDYIADDDERDTEEGEAAIHEFNLRFAAGRKMTGLCCASGDPEEDFFKVSRWMRRPIIDICEDENGRAFANPRSDASRMSRAKDECVCM